ncbi:MAG: ANTAR domain-containing protein [Acetobacteraceae bacterium]|nr:ANTAR domain-containing protein [Acetobacteraceae bacterium]
MAIEILRDLRGLRIEVMHPPDSEGVSLAEHLLRIGCVTSTVWPLPDELDVASDLVFVAVEHDGRDALRRLFACRDRGLPTVIAVVGYEDPSTLQLVLEIGAQGVVERPIRPFGLLTQLAVARSLWLRQQGAGRQVRRLERKLAGSRMVQRARLILMTRDGMSEEEAYQTIRRRAMSKRAGMEDAAADIVDAHKIVRVQTHGE